MDKKKLIKYSIAFDSIDVLPHAVTCYAGRRIDSKLVSQQVQPFGLTKCACRSLLLQQFFKRAANFGRQLDALGVKWDMPYIQGVQRGGR